MAIAFFNIRFSSSSIYLLRKREMLNLRRRYILYKLIMVYYDNYNYNINNNVSEGNL